MRFSIIIPVYNVEIYLRECLDSVLNQSFEDWEAICVNDGSTDHSVNILDEYASNDHRFKFINQPNGGLSAARNTGMKAAKGEYILFLDSDDWLELDTLEVISEALADEDMVCFSGRRFFESEGQYHDVDQLLERTYTSGMDYYNENALLRRDFAFVCVVLRAYRKDYLLAHELWFKEGIFHEDNLFTPFACYYAKRVNYRVRANSITTTSNTKRLRDLLKTANTLAAFFLYKQDFDKTTIYRAITHHYQVVFECASKSEGKELRGICDWGLYRKVSRTKLRHRWNYLRNRIVLDLMIM